MSKIALDDVLEYIAEKTEDEQAAQAFLLNLNQDELEYLFDMAERHYEKPVGVESGVNKELFDRIIKSYNEVHPRTTTELQVMLELFEKRVKEEQNEHGTWGGFPLT